MSHSEATCGAEHPLLKDESGGSIYCDLPPEHSPETHHAPDPNPDALDGASLFWTGGDE